MNSYPENCKQETQQLVDQLTDYKIVGNTYRKQLQEEGLRGIAFLREFERGELEVQKLQTGKNAWKRWKRNWWIVVWEKRAPEWKD